MDVMQSMSVFRRVAEASSFSAVARESAMSQSSVSKHVASLEQRLGTKLLNRSTRQLNLTESGTEYYHYCVRILNEFAEAEASVGKGKITPTGTLRLSSTVPIGKVFVLPLMEDFLARYPDISIDYVMEDRHIDLVKEGIDLAIRVGPLEDSSLIARKIGSCERVVVGSPGYFLQHGFPRTPQDLLKHNCLQYAQLKSPREWHFTSKQHGDETVKIEGRFRASSNEAMLHAALNGLGIATLCDWHVEDLLKKGKLRAVMKDYQLTPYDINVVYPERKFVPQKVKRLIEHLRSNINSC